MPPRECVLAIWCLQNSELVINTTVRAGIIIFDLSDNMAQNTIICGFGSISGLKFRDNIVKKGADLPVGGHMGDVKEIRSNGKILILWQN